MSKTTAAISKEKFEAYRRVQNSGRFNMLMDAKRAASAANLTLDEWFAIIEHYDTLAKQYPETGQP